MSPPLQHKGQAVACILLAILLANMQDAVVKSVSADLPAYETVIFRTLTSFPLLLGWLLRSGSIDQLFAAQTGALFLRSLLLCSAYFAFIASIAALPLATAVSIYFTMPFFVAGLSGYALGERVPLYRWLAIIVGFIGVIINVRPDWRALEPSVFLALYSAFGYAWGQMWGRKISQRVAPAVVANWQNLIYLLVGVVVALVVSLGHFQAPHDKSLAFLTRAWAWPTHHQLGLLMVMGILSAAASGLFVNAYRLADASFVAPFEYSAIIWATLNGMLFFHDMPDGLNMLGTLIVIAAGMFMLWKDRVTPREIHSTP